MNKKQDADGDGGAERRACQFGYSRSETQEQLGKCGVLSCKTDADDTLACFLVVLSAADLERRSKRYLDLWNGASAEQEGKPPKKNNNRYLCMCQYAVGMDMLSR